MLKKEITKRKIKFKRSKVYNAEVIYMPEKKLKFILYLPFLLLHFPVFQMKISQIKRTAQHKKSTQQRKKKENMKFTRVWHASKQLSASLWEWVGGHQF